MQTSLRPEEQSELYSAIKQMILDKSKVVKDNYEEEESTTDPKFFNNTKLKRIISEALGLICDYIYRPDRYMLINPTLQYVWVDFAIDLLTSMFVKKDAFSSDGGGIVIDPNNISEYKEGDTTVKMATGSQKSNSQNPLIYYGDTFEIFDKYKPNLSRWRRPI